MEARAKSEDSITNAVTELITVPANFNGGSEEQASGSKKLRGWFSEGIRHEACRRKDQIEGSRRFLQGACEEPLPLLRPCHESHDDQY